MTVTPTFARTRTIAARAVVLGTALAVGLTGCSGDDKPDPSETPKGALDEMFEAAYESWDDEGSNAKQMQVEEAIAQCMADQGFEYVPVDYAAMGGVSSAARDEDSDELAWGTLEFAKKWGYGITTNPYEDSTETAAPIDEGSSYEDPNQPIVEAMSETEQAAYYAALYGESQEVVDPEAEPVEPSWEEMGCSGAAQHEIYGDAAFGSDADPFAELMEEMNRMWESIGTDDRVLANEAEWATCMADAGYPNLAKVADAEQGFYAKVDPIWNDAYSDLGPDATQEDYDAVEASIQDELAALSEEEIDTAVADYTCREEVGYDDVYSEVNLDLQQQFYDAHKTELEEWIAYQEEQSS